MRVAIVLLFAATPLIAQQAPPQDDLTIYQIVDAVSAQRIESDIRTLVSFGTRHTLSDTLSPTRGIGAARRWIKAEFDRISAACGGCLEVFYVSEIYPAGARRLRESEETNIANVVAIQRGTSDPNRMVMMSGDIDSRISNAMNFTDSAPGANDNASGMAGTIEAARVLTRYQFNGSIVYLGLSGEEQGLYGGHTVARMAVDSGWNVQAVLNNDMIGNIEGISGVIENTTARVFSDGTPPTETEQERGLRRFAGGEVDGVSRQLARYVDRTADQYVPDLDVMMIYRLDRFGRGGHHRPFADVGFPAVRIMETHENYNRQHQDIRVESGIAYGDVLEGVDFEYAAKLTALNAATLAALAWAPGPPANVRICGAARPAARLAWDPPTDSATVAGYRVYWRLTDSPSWDDGRWVGNVTGHTFDGLVIDNYFFGIAAVGADGNESAVVFPRRPRRGERC
ncbi:MAG: M28 family peptidase [Gemmatimonadales bacterium]|nr:M28 family peptidase [Gemmatimonadales bacterium]NIN12867.1 M28 family peptidase [Gemmatimonadales bacterium]NIN51045.1 M28 family peptidase [Gemmatimonadales bacterium]NIP08509.1 M28 family peptidase [Gemmatimonadales bacterium]NIR02549.1 M28 family peptidase [Gemmatimonadales bacterium]